MLNAYRRYTTSKEGIIKGSNLDKKFKDNCLKYATNLNFKKHSLNLHSFTDCNLISKPDFISKNLIIECKYSKYGCLYGVNIEQMINHINLFDNAEKTIEFIFYIVAYDGSSYIIEARELCSFYANNTNRAGIKHYYNTSNKGKTYYPISFIKAITKTRELRSLEDLFLINANKFNALK